MFIINLIKQLVYRQHYTPKSKRQSVTEDGKRLNKKFHVFYSSESRIRRDCKVCSRRKEKSRKLKMFFRKT